MTALQPPGARHTPHCAGFFCYCPQQNTGVVNFSSLWLKRIAIAVLLPHPHPPFLTNNLGLRRKSFRQRNLNILNTDHCQDMGQTQTTAKIRATHIPTSPSLLTCVHLLWPLTWFLTVIALCCLQGWKQHGERVCGNCVLCCQIQLKGKRGWG